MCGKSQAAGWVQLASLEHSSSNLNHSVILFLFQYLLFKTVIPKSLEKDYFSGQTSNKSYY